MLNWYLTEMEQRYSERVQEVEFRQLLHEVSMANPTPHVMDRALVNLGRFLAEWGRQLEVRHSAACNTGLLDGTGVLSELAIEAGSPRSQSKITERSYKR